MSEDADGERVFFQSRKVRWSILAAYWAVILLALPLWWTTTSIQRLSLPTSRVEDLSRKDLRFPVDIVLDSSSGVDTKALSAKLQSLINARLSPDVRAWLDVHVHPHPIPREFPATYHASPTPNKQTTQARIHTWSSSTPVPNIQKCRGAASSLLVTDVRANPLVKQLDLTFTSSFTLEISELAYRPFDTPTHCGQPTKDCQIFPPLPACILTFERERSTWKICCWVGSK